MVLLLWLVFDPMAMTTFYPHASFLLSFFGCPDEFAMFEVVHPLTFISVAVRFRLNTVTLLGIIDVVALV